MFRAAVALGALVLVVALAGGALCKLFFDCHLRGELPPLSKRVKEGHGLTALPPGFHQSVLVRGLAFPTDYALLSDGRILVAQKDGLVRVVQAGRVLQRPFLDLRRRVAIESYRGVMAIQVDPRFEENGFVYVLYAQRSAPGEPPRGRLSPTSMRLIRVVARGNAALRGSERVILGAAGHASSCSALPPTADCLPLDFDHGGGGIAFTQGGTMFVSTGDGGGVDHEIEPSALLAQSVDSLSGKVLRITRDGTGVPSNPFWNGDASANRSKVWAYGLRNPFRLALRGEIPYVGDVGSKDFEEIDAVPRRANLGWPCYEGHRRHTRYHGTPVCRALYAIGTSAVQWPSLALGRDVAASVTGGVFYAGSRFPAKYRGAYFFGDWERSWLRVVRFDADGKPLANPVLFAAPAAGPVKLAMGANEDLYYLALNVGEIRRVRYGQP